ncbi:MAG TPA: GTPase domain-containing protein [Polyangia bacterium]|nr:GTPase domain-containing protein [Polyangia bacterium]
MSTVNVFTREISLKIVYYGPGLGGKTSSLQYIHRALKPDSRGQLVSLATGVDRTLYFDFLPLKLPKLRGYSVRVQLYTVPGQVHYNSTRKLVLTGADGVVFVADSQRDRENGNIESLENLRDNLLDQGQRIDEIPLVFQYNKRDAPDVLSMAELEARLNPYHAPAYETVATDGRGIFESLKAITARTLNDLRRRGLWDGGSPEPRLTPGPQFSRESESITERLKELSEAVVPSAGPGPRPVEAAAGEGVVADRAAFIEATERAARSPLRPIVSPAAAAAAKESAAAAKESAAAAKESAAAKDAAVPTAVGTNTPGSFSAPLPLAQQMPRGPALSELLPAGEAREAAIAVETQLERGDYAEAVRLAARAFANAATTSGSSANEGQGEDAMLMHALMLGIPGERYLRFREAAARCQAGAASSTDALFALFFLVDSELRR